MIEETGNLHAVTPNNEYMTQSYCRFDKMKKISFYDSM